MRLDLMPYITCKNMRQDCQVQGIAQLKSLSKADKPFLLLPSTELEQSIAFGYSLKDPAHTRDYERPRLRPPKFEPYPHLLASSQNYVLSLCLLQPICRVTGVSCTNSLEHSAAPPSLRPSVAIPGRFRRCLRRHMRRVLSRPAAQRAD